MKKKCSNVGVVILVLSLTLMSTTAIYAQRFVDVPAGYGTLQSIIAADSANRVANPNTVYLVHRGNADSVYYLTSTLTNWGSMPLQIISVGAGAIPRFILTTLSDGSAISPMISARANLTLKGVFLDGLNTLGVTVDRVVRVQGDSVRVVLDSVQLNLSTQSFVRVDNTKARIYLKDCRVSNVFSDWANARGVDNRGVTIDTLSVVGCSFYRLGFRVYRDGGGILKYGYFDHNTIVEMGNSILGLGSTINITFTNNLAVNCAFLGQGPASNGRLLGINALPGSGQTSYIRNNVFDSDSAALAAAYHAMGDTLRPVPWFADTLVAVINNAGLAGTNISSHVSFVMPPGNLAGAVKVDSIVRWYYRNPSVNGGDASILKVDHTELVNLAYNTDAPAYTFGSDGKPVGATDWFGITLAVKNDPEGTIPARFSLDHNYPNPFNPSTTINYALPHAGHVTLVVYDLLGRQVGTLVDGAQSAGNYRTTFDARGLASGTYIYRLNVDGRIVGARTMLLLK